MEKSVILYHKSCPTSLKLLKRLKDKKLLNSVELVDCGQNVLRAVGEGAVSVPTVKINGGTIDFGPIDFGNVINAIKNRLVTRVTRDIREEIAYTILDNQLKRLRE